ncbi:MAG: replicative DNA helicase [Pyrinomonadaceae bacterium]|nr:replicative DNA helicase [Pyrinomonadaceae bacterium]MCX7640943.1 replicative DNA helicase [Pyrinomonadaceae bacterium]MDW8304725.1 replicative DNA helicase [Acidobacteriota bacterium]
MPKSSEAFRDDFLEKPLPSNIEAEKIILGSILLDNSHISEAIEALKPEDFYSPFHRQIFRAMIELFQEGEKIDALLVAEKLKKDNLLERMGGIATIINLTNGLHHLPNIFRYAKIVRDKALVRRLINSCNHIISEALAEETATEEILDKAEQAIFAISQERTTQGFAHIKPVAEQVLVKLKEYAEERSHALTGLATGFRDLDQLTSGLQKGDLIIVAARPGMGKTAFALTIAQNAAIYENAVVAVFSLEMSKEQLVMRMICSEARVDASRFRRGRISKDEWKRVAEALGKLSEAKIFIDDTPAISVLEMRAKARRLISEQKRLDLIILDYLQLMRSSQRYESRQYEVSQISRELKSLAKELNVPVIAISQLSRAPESRNPPRPQMSDLRDSGSIEQDADVVIFIYREEYYRKTEENENMAEAIVAKQRNGPTDEVKLVFLKNFTRFENFYEEAREV